jgi:beta-N-acetylhexosaminidase
LPRAFICGCKTVGLDAEERAFLREADPFGLILFKRNVLDRAQVSELTRDFREAVGRAEAPVLVDQEGGRVQRLAPPQWPAYPAAARFLAELPRPVAIEAAKLVAELIAHDLRDVGITVDCAPVLDVADELTHSVIGTRAYARAPEEVADLGRAVIEGFLAGGVLPVIKHMPGHGRARVDSHLQLPRVEASRAELAARDFLPFKALSGAPAAMTAHLVYTAIDASAPATQSKRIVDEVIRGEIGFKGFLISDDMSMKALSGAYSERARAIFAAGVDLALHCSGVLEDARAVAAASPQLAGVSLERAKAALSVIPTPPPPFDAEAAREKLLRLWPKALA